MNPYIEKLKQQVADNPPNFGDADSVLGLLYECFNENNPYDNEQIKADFHELYRQMNGIPLRQMDSIIYPVCKLCRDHERSGFVEGVKIGILLGAGKRGLLMVDVGDSEIGPHRIRLSVILRVTGMPGDPQVQIETENTKYILKKTEEGRPMIIRNAIRCNICGDEIESKHRHDYVQCKCGACAVDGGHDYLRRCFKEKGCYTDISETVPEDENG